MIFFNKKKKKESEDIYTQDYNSLLKQFESVVEINNAMIGVLKRDEVLDLVTKKLVSVLGVSFADILEWNENDRSLSVVSVTAPAAAISLTERALGKPFSEIKFYLDKDKDNDYIRSFETQEIV